MASASASPASIDASQYGATSMMENLPKFTPGAASILTGAQQEALKRGNPYCGSEHMVLSLLLNSSSRIYSYIKMKLSDPHEPTSSQWKDSIISLLNGPLLLHATTGNSSSSSSSSSSSNYPPFSASMHEIFDVVRQISSSPVKDGEQIITDGLVTSEFLVAAMMLHGLNMGATILSRVSKGDINSWTILEAINVNPDKLHVNRGSARQSNTFVKGQTPFISSAGPFVVGNETLPTLECLPPAPTENSNWLIPGRLIIGSKPSEAEASRLSDAGVTTFVSLIGEHSFSDYQKGNRSMRYPSAVKRGSFIHFPIAVWSLKTNLAFFFFFFPFNNQYIYI
jgi:hypothetical protein